MPIVVTLSAAKALAARKEILRSAQNDGLPRRLCNRPAPSAVYPTFFLDVGIRGRILLNNTSGRKHRTERVTREKLEGNGRTRTVVEN